MVQDQIRSVASRRRESSRGIAFALPLAALTFFGSSLLGSSDALAQNKPFPYAGGYVAGFTPSNVADTDARAVYTTWKKEYLKTDCGNGMYRVEFNSPAGSTVSEGMGYGMLLTAYFGDRTEFDGLWKFAQKNFNANHVMGWKVTCSGFDQSSGGNASATDGDGDMALALVAAVDQWGSEYKQPALDLLTAIKAKDFTTCSKSGRAMATNGDWDKGCSGSNTSYWMPGYYRVFHEFTGDAFWAKVADDADALWMASRNGTTGLSGNEVNEDATTTSGQAVVNYNGCRTPWRAVVDYLWYGTPAAKDVSDKITDWADGKGLTTLVDGYNITGTPTGSWNGSDCFNGGYTTAAMANSQARVEKFSTYFKTLNVDNYYETSLRALYMLTLSGHFWKPGTPATPPVGGGADDAGAGDSDGGTVVVPSDAGTGGSGGGGGGGGGGKGGTTLPDGGTSVNADTPGSGDAGAGCSCRATGGGQERAGWGMATMALIALGGAARRRRTRR